MLRLDWLYVDLTITILCNIGYSIFIFCTVHLWWLSLCYILDNNVALSILLYLLWYYQIIPLICDKSEIQYELCEYVNLKHEFFN